MKILKTSCFLSFCFSLISIISGAQTSDLQNFPLEKENNIVRINTLFKHSTGYIFAGSEAGLFKFDGQRYHAIPLSQSLKPDTITAIFEDSRKTIWAGLNNGRIANMVNKRLTFFEPESARFSKRVTAFTEDAKGRIWLSSNGEGLRVISKGRVDHFDEQSGLSDNNVRCLAATTNGDILAGTDQGLNICRFEAGRKTIKKILPRDGLPDYIVTAIAAAGNNKFWIGFEENGFCLYDHASGKISVPVKKGDWVYGGIISMLANVDGIWIGTKQNRLMRYSLNTGIMKQIQTISPGQEISSLIEDNQGNLWFASPEKGMVRTTGNTLHIQSLPGNPSFEDVHAILSDRDGNTWFNDQANQIVKLSVANGDTAIRKLLLPGLNEKIDITAIQQDRFGTLWVGTMGRGLYIVDPKTFAHRAFTENPVFLNAGILSISIHSDAVYVSSLEGSMRVLLPAEGAGIRNRYEYQNFDSKSAGTNYVYNIFHDSKDRVWFATDGRGLSMLEKGKFHYFNDTKLIADDRIYSITEDRAGNIWFSTAGAGIYKYDGRAFSNYGLKEGLSDLDISVLKADRAGNIVIVHKTGLDILNPVTGTIHFVGSSQGVPTVNAEDIGAVSSDTAGNVVVSTAQGLLTYFSPERSLPKPTALIESVQLFLKDIGETHSNVFKHDENNFTFNYNALYYSDPERVYYQYRLSGLDSNWVNTTDKHQNFPRLNPGKYTFRIRASLNKSFTHPDEASYSFVITQPFYTTIWFILSSIGLAGLLLFFYVKSRERNLQKMANLSYEKSKFQLEVLRNQVNPHFLFNSFNTLISTIEEDPTLAVEYAEQLSNFFRNIVSQRDRDVILVKEELTLLEAYSFLQQKRYAKSLKIDIDIPTEIMQSASIPPLTLQMLMENAIKHNAVSRETPLHIRISVIEGNRLEVKNNINPKLDKAAGTELGLQNIVNRYKLLSAEPVKIRNDKKYFIVSLPILNLLR